MAENAPNAQKPKRKETATYHNAAFSALGHYLRKQKENGEVTLKDEHYLSQEPPRIDIIIIKKIRDVKIDRVWGRIFREHNIIEYKSPVDVSPSLAIFDKVVHGYAGLYASQEKVKLSDMTATFICPRQPQKLFKTLESEFGYKILQKGDGVYYIILDGVAVEKSLAIQVVVNPELPDSDFFLKSLTKGIGRETARKIVELPLDDEESRISLSHWWDVMWLENREILTLEANMNKKDRLIKYWKETGFLTDALLKERLEGKQEGEQIGELRGEQRGMTQILNYLKNGHTIEEAEKMFALQ